jgi:CubicO group peptidase (beta-lactamase class C family)
LIFIANIFVTLETKSEPIKAIESDRGFLAREMFCADRGYPIPTMEDGDRNYTKDCYKVGSFTNMEQLFKNKKILKSEEKYNLEYAEGNNKNKFNDALSNLIENYPITALLVAKDNKIITEYYGYGRKPTQHFASFSMHKSFNALLIGIALDQKLIKSIDEPIIEYIEEFSNSEWGAVTIRQLLSMTSGIKPEQRKLIIPLLFGNGSVIDMLKNVGDRITPPGTVFSYNDANTLILSKIIERVFNKGWHEAFASEIWSKLGVEDNASVLTSRKGEVLANAFFNARPRDYMRLALLMVNEGRNLLGDQVIPIKWANKILGEGEEFSGCPIGPGMNCPGLGPLGYTYQTWRSSSGTSIFFLGKYGQLIFVHPASNAVVVILSTAKSGRLGDIFTKELKIFLRQAAQ